MLAGPGAISSVMVLVGQVPTLWHWEMGAILGSIALTSLVSYWVLAGAGRVRKVMGETGIRILVRIMGLLLVALAMQFFVNGLTDLGVIPRTCSRNGVSHRNGGLSTGCAACIPAGGLLFSEVAARGIARGSKSRLQ
jgi:hypothetical protein